MLYFTYISVVKEKGGKGVLWEAVLVIVYKIDYTL